MPSGIFFSSSVFRGQKSLHISPDGQRHAGRMPERRRDFGADVLMSSPLNHKERMLIKNTELPGFVSFFVRKWTAKLKKSSWNNWFGLKSSQVWILDLDFWLLHFCGLLILFCWRRCWEAKLYLLLLFFEIDDIRESFLIKISNISPLVLEVAI